MSSIHFTTQARHSRCLEGASSPLGLGCQTPVLLLVHKRPAHTQGVLAILRQVRPKTLLVAADGPETDAQCQAVRELVMAAVDWECRLETRFSALRQGCRQGVAGALDWAFSRHEECIILEDDCVPDTSFFPFCEALLARYRDVPDVMQICGSNLTGMSRAGESYYFSRFGPVWGWATWRRAWNAYDVEMRAWPELRNSRRLRELCPEHFEASWRRKVFDKVASGRLDTWDYQWAFAKLLRGGLSIIPAGNLISNVGFGEDATHTKNAQAALAALPTVRLEASLRHPAAPIAWLEADRAYLNRVVGLPKTPLSPRALRHMIQSFCRP